MKITVVLFFILTSAVAAAPLMTPEKLGIIERGENALLNARYNDASHIYDSLCAVDPGDPACPLYRAVIIQTKMIDREADIERDRFFNLLDSTKILAENRLDSCTRSDSALCYLYLGHQEAYRSIWESRFGSTVSAVSYGFRAKGKYRRGLETDPTLYDLFLGMGLYHYWKTVKSGFLKTAGIFNDDRQKGIDQILLAADSSAFSKTAARSALVWVLIEEKEYDAAVDLASELKNEYPGGLFFDWPQAEALYKAGMFEPAARKFEYILNELKRSPGNYYNIIEATYYLYKSLKKIDRDDDAREAVIYLRTVERNIPRDTERRQRRHLSYLKRRF